MIAEEREITEEPEQTLARAGFNNSVKDGIVLIEDGISV